MLEKEMSILCSTDCFTCLPPVFGPKNEASATRMASLYDSANDFDTAVTTVVLVVSMTLGAFPTGLTVVVWAGPVYGVHASNFEA